MMMIVVIHITSQNTTYMVIRFFLTAFTLYLKLNLT